MSVRRMSIDMVLGHLSWLHGNNSQIKSKRRPTTDLHQLAVFWASRDTPYIYGHHVTHHIWASRAILTAYGHSTQFPLNIGISRVAPWTTLNFVRIPAIIVFAKTRVWITEIRNVSDSKLSLRTPPLYQSPPRQDQSLDN